MENLRLLTNEGEFDFSELLNSRSPAFEKQVWILAPDNFGENNFASHALNSKTVDALVFGCKDCVCSLIGAVEQALELSAPKYIVVGVWGDGSGECIQALEKLVAISKEKGAVPILTTALASDPAQFAKMNAAVIASGEKYVDLASLKSCDNLFVDGAFTEYAACLVFSRIISEFPALITPSIPFRSVSADLLNSENGKINLPINRVRDGKYMVFNAEISELSDSFLIKVGHGFMTSYGKWFEITATEMKLFSYTSWVEVPLSCRNTWEHSLTLKDFITVIITADADNGGNSVILITNGGFVKYAEYGWNACEGEIFASIDGGVLKNAKIDWNCKDYDKEVWAIGASYFSLSDPARWPFYIYENGYDKNIFIAGRGGMNTDQGLSEFESALESGCAPKHLVWGVCLNDGPDPQECINQKFYTNMQRLMQMCNDKGIELYLMSAVNTPKSFNSYKLDYLFNKKEGFANYNYHLIDITRALGAWEVGSSWYEGMIHTDQTHPRAIGAISMFLEFICDAPVLLGADYSTLSEKNAENLSSGDVIGIEHKEGSDSFIALKIDFASLLSGSVLLGNGRNVGASYLRIDKKEIKVCVNEDGVEKVIQSTEHELLTEHFLNVFIHREKDTARVYAMSSGFTGSRLQTPSLFKLDCNWDSTGDAFVTLEDQSATKVNLKYLVK